MREKLFFLFFFNTKLKCYVKGKIGRTLSFLTRFIKVTNFLICVKVPKRLTFWYGGSNDNDSTNVCPLFNQVLHWQGPNQICTVIWKLAHK